MRKGDLCKYSTPYTVREASNVQNEVKVYIAFANICSKSSFQALTCKNLMEEGDKSLL